MTHVDNYCKRSVDAFYVHDSSGAKPADAKAVTTLKKTLTAIFGRPRLPWAEASSVR